MRFMTSAPLGPISVKIMEPDYGRHDSCNNIGAQAWLSGEGRDKQVARHGPGSTFRGVPGQVSGLYSQSGEQPLLEATGILLQLALKLREQVEGVQRRQLVHLQRLQRLQRLLVARLQLGPGLGPSSEQAELPR